MCYIININMSIGIIKSNKMIYVLDEKQLKFAYNYTDVNNLLLWIDNILVKDKTR